MEPARRSAYIGRGEAPVVGAKAGIFPSLVLRNKMTALVVDGNEFSQLIEEALLNHYRVQTQVVDNGSDAVELIASGEKFDLILIDKSLPIMDGFETAGQIRGMGVTCKMLGLTFFAYEADRLVFLYAGVDEFIEKPLKAETLVEILREIDGNE